MKGPDKQNLVRQGADLVPDGSNIKAVLFVGAGTRINGPITVKGGAPCRIGKYCALGDGLKIITSDHGSDLVNLNALLQKKITGSTGHISKGGVTIGNNVWIGDEAIILSGVRVGNGAIIGAGAIVTKDVPRYSVAVGSPAKVIKERFRSEMMDLLDKLEWWNWTLEEMKANSFLFEPGASDLKVSDLMKRIRISPGGQ